MALVILPWSVGSCSPEQGLNTSVIYTTYCVLKKGNCILDEKNIGLEENVMTKENAARRLTSCSARQSYPWTKYL
jgi:hypothetical protein